MSFIKKSIFGTFRDPCDTRLGNFPYSNHLVCCTNIMNSDEDRPVLQFFLVSLESLFACSITSLQ